MNTKTSAGVHLPRDTMQLLFAAVAVIALSLGVQLWLFPQEPLERAEAPSAGEALQKAFAESVARRAETRKPSGDHVLSEHDRETYSEIFEMQQKKQWHDADRLMLRVGEPLLHGHLLAERYLHEEYVSSYGELAAWLKRYRDHPQAYRIYRLALRKLPAGSRAPAAIGKPARLSGYGDSHVSQRYTPGAPANQRWQQGMNAWKQQQYSQAANYFVSILEMGNLPSWDESAAAYWTWRAKIKLGQSAQARKYLVRASQHSRSFYGLLALKELGHDLRLMKHTEPLAKEKKNALLQNPAIRRIVALSEVGQSRLAEKEMRVVFAKAKLRMRKDLLVLAHQLRLPSVQVPMARVLSGSGQSYDFALYPITSWAPREGYIIDAALIHAIARQESGFNAQAKSAAGASGLMQLMPATAEYIARKAGYTSELRDDPSRLNDPSVNLALGQHYLRYLISKKYIGSNLVFLASAYNAGPGNLIKWKKTLDFGSDPLLFVESIPLVETRHYVMQVLANYWMYASLKNGDDSALLAMAQGHWPRYHSAPDVALLN